MNESDFKNLWVGDKIRSKKTGITGRFEGLHSSGKARMNSGGKIRLIPIRSLEKLPDTIVEDTFSFEEEPEKGKGTPFELASEEIDLHIEKLRPDLATAIPERIVDIQIKEFQLFLERSKAAKLKRLLIIHGKGAGVLRNHIHECLKVDNDIFQYHLKHNGGATEVLLY